MIHVFDNGRIVYTDSLMRPEDYAISIAVDTLPAIPYVQGKKGYFRADLDKGEIVIDYRDAPPPAPEPPLPLTTDEIIMLALADIYEELEAMKND